MTHWNCKEQSESATLTEAVRLQGRFPYAPYVGLLHSGDRFSFITGQFN